MREPVAERRSHEYHCHNCLLPRPFTSIPPRASLGAARVGLSNEPGHPAHKTGYSGSPTSAAQAISMQLRFAEYR